MKYTAITIGPILKTLQGVKSTKAIWAASYMFSYLMRKIITKAKFDIDNVILPFYEDNDLKDDNKLGVGLFPDRLIYQGEIDEIDTIIKDVISEFAEEVYDDLQNDTIFQKEIIDKKEKSINSISKEDVKDFLQDYLRIIPLEIDLNENENIIFKVSELLDVAELKLKTLQNADNDVFLTYFFEKYKDNRDTKKGRYNFLHLMEFAEKSEKLGKEEHFRKFRSTAEIATAEYYKEEEKYNNEYFYNSASEEIKRGQEYKDDQKEFYQTIKKGAGNRFRNYQKYITVIQADGDNIGSFIKELFALEDKGKRANYVSRFSENLLKFSKEAVTLINEYNGSPVYAGGDDLLFFCPVAHTKYDEKGKVVIGKTFFDLINQVDCVFKKYFTCYKDDEVDFLSIIKKSKKKPSMSYGVSISYYKFPLNEALEQGVNQLFYTAKQTCKKNAVSYAVLKHSGQYFGTTFHKDSKSYETYLQLINEKVKDGEFVHSVAQKLEPQNIVIFEIGKNCDEKERDEMFDNFFANNFNEAVHLQKKPDGSKELIPFLKKVKQLFKAVYTENKVYMAIDEKENLARHKENSDKIYAALRFIEFINNQEER